MSHERHCTFRRLGIYGLAQYLHYTHGLLTSLADGRQLGSQDSRISNFHKATGVFIETPERIPEWPLQRVALPDKIGLGVTENEKKTSMR
jgi:hypothetical protein